MFDSVLYAKSKDKFDSALAIIREQRSAVAESIDRIEHSLWAEYAFPGSRYGLTSSNVAEQCNKWFLEQRRLPIIQLFDHIWLKMMGEWVKRSSTAVKHTSSFNAAITLRLEQAKFDSRTYTVYLGDVTDTNIYAKVVPTEVAWSPACQRTVTLHPASLTSVCSCLQAHPYRAPCKHVLAVFEELGVEASP